MSMYSAEKAQRSCQSGRGAIEHFAFCWREVRKKRITTTGTFKFNGGDAKDGSPMRPWRAISAGVDSIDPPTPMV